MEKILTRILTSCKIVKIVDGVVYIRTSAVNKGESVIKLTPFNEMGYISKQVDLLTGPNRISFQKKVIDGLELGKWYKEVPYWVFLDAVFYPHRKEGKRHDR